MSSSETPTENKKKKRTIVVEPCPPLVATAYLLVRGACLGVVGGSMQQVSCSMMQPTYIKEKSLSGKFSLNLGKKLGTLCELDLPEDAQAKSQLLDKIQAAANRLVQESPNMTLESCCYQEAIEKYGKGISNDGLKKTQPHDVVHVVAMEGIVVAIPPAIPAGIRGIASIQIQQDVKNQASLVNCGKKARKAEIVLKFNVVANENVEEQLAALPTMDAGVLEPLLAKKVRMPEGMELLQKQKQERLEQERVEQERVEKEQQQQQEEQVPTEELKQATLDKDKPPPPQEEMIVTMETVSGKVDYDKLVQDFGSKLLTDEIISKLEKVMATKRKETSLHRFLRRNIFFSHRDLDVLLDCVLKQDSCGKVYLYTGRGPSSAAMHLGHLIPFLFTKWLQEALDCPLVIQMTDDEKFLFKGTYSEEEGDNLNEFRRLTIENARDIIACGFDYNKTFLFSNMDHVGSMYPNICRIWKAVTTNTVNGIFGFDGTSNIGKIAFPAIQAAPSFASSFPTVLNTQGRRDSRMSCLIPCAIDQDPYFRMTRDVAHKLVTKQHPLGGKPALIHSKFFPPLQGTHGKMSSSDANSAIFLTDTPDEIERKIKQHAYSGGQETKQKQQELGADLQVDVAFQWLKFFLEDDDELQQIEADYGTGSGKYWSTAQVKQRLIQVLQELVGQHQERRAKITDEQVKKWMTERCIV